MCVALQVGGVGQVCQAAQPAAWPELGAGEGEPQTPLIKAALSRLQAVQLEYALAAGRELLARVAQHIASLASDSRISRGHADQLELAHRNLLHQLAEAALLLPALVWRWVSLADVASAAAQQQHHQQRRPAHLYACGAAEPGSMASGRYNKAGRSAVELLLQEALLVQRASTDPSCTPRWAYHRHIGIGACMLLAAYMMYACGAMLPC